MDKLCSVSSVCGFGWFESRLIASLLPQLVCPIANHVLPKGPRVLNPSSSCSSPQFSTPSLFGKDSAAHLATIIHPLLTLLASVTRQQLLQKIAYLLAENRILRSKLPDRISLSNQERLKLVRAGKKLGPRIKDLISIVSYSTFRKWVRSIEDSTPKRLDEPASSQLPIAHRRQRFEMQLSLPGQ